MKKISLQIVLLIVLFIGIDFLFTSDVYSQRTEAMSNNNENTVPAATREILRKIYEGNDYNARVFRGRWLPDGKGYVVVETESSSGRHTLVKYDTKSGKRSILFDPAELIKGVQIGDEIRIEDYQIAGKSKQILFKISYTKDDSLASGYWILALESGRIEKVVAGLNNIVSPDGSRILFTREGNLYMYEIQNESVSKLTTDAVPGTVSYGQASWSSNSKKISFVRTDESAVARRSFLVPGDPSYPGVAETRFARVGGTISALRIGVIETSKNETRWISLAEPSEGFYLGQVSWIGSSEKLLVEKLNRPRTHREFLIADVNQGSVSPIYEESDPDWVVASYNTNGGLEWVNNFNNFLVLTEQDGWRHAFVGSLNDKNQKLITPGKFDIIDRLQVDEETGWFYYYASPDNGTQKYLYRSRLDGSGSPERITPIDQPGTHDYTMDPNGEWAFHTYSTANLPPITELVSLPGHRVVRVLEDNQSLRKRMSELNVKPKEFFRVDIGNGVVMDGWMIKPRNFDFSKKYPVFVYVYGEPHAQTVLDAWRHSYTEFHRAIADLGYIVISMDNRGTPCPKGAAWRRAVSGSLGPLSTEEQAAGIKGVGRKFLFVDTSRVGIWGWSGGGSNTLNAMFRKPDVYQVGIAVAPKPQPWLYNAWFQEIYMKTREVNPEGYAQSAPINFAEGLKGDLLIIHGTGETNTHLQITEGLVDRLIKLRKQFDYMTYPNRDHGIWEGEGTSLHLRTLIVRYLVQHLPAGAR